MDQASSRRWADLLLCEFHAHQILAEVGLANAGARLLDADGRRFLEIPRFDRRGPGGRRGVVSLEALASSLIGSLSRSWLEATAEWYRRGIIDRGSFATIQRLHAFGELIGNSDMHFGNLAFFLDDTLPWRETAAWAENFWSRVAGDVRLSPEFARIADDAGAGLVRLRRHVG